MATAMLDDLTRLDIHDFINIMEEEDSDALAAPASTGLSSCTLLSSPPSGASSPWSAPAVAAVRRLNALLGKLELRVQRFFSVLDPEKRRSIPVGELRLGLRLLAAFVPSEEALATLEVDTLLQLLAGLKHKARSSSPPDYVTQEELEVLLLYDGEPVGQLERVAEASAGERRGSLDSSVLTRGSSLDERPPERRGPRRQSSGGSRCWGCVETLGASQVDQTCAGSSSHSSSSGGSGGSSSASTSSNWESTGAEARGDLGRWRDEEGAQSGADWSAAFDDEEEGGRLQDQPVRPPLPQHPPPRLPRMASRVTDQPVATSVRVEEQGTAAMEVTTTSSSRAGGEVRTTRTSRGMDEEEEGGGDVGMDDNGGEVQADYEEDGFEDDEEVQRRLSARVTEYEYTFEEEEAGGEELERSARGGLQVSLSRTVDLSSTLRPPPVAASLDARLVVLTSLHQPGPDKEEEEGVDAATAAGIIEAALQMLPEEEEGEEGGMAAEEGGEVLARLQDLLQSYPTTSDDMGHSGTTGLLVEEEEDDAPAPSVPAALPQHFSRTAPPSLVVGSVPTAALSSAGSCDGQGMAALESALGPKTAPANLLDLLAATVTAPFQLLVRAASSISPSSSPRAGSKPRQEAWTSVTALPEPLADPQEGGVEEDVVVWDVPVWNTAERLEEPGQCGEGEQGPAALSSLLLSSMRMADSTAAEPTRQSQRRPSDGAAAPAATVGPSVMGSSKLPITSSRPPPRRKPPPMPQQPSSPPAATGQGTAAAASAAVRRVGVEGDSSDQGGEGVWEPCGLRGLSPHCERVEEGLRRSIWVDQHNADGSKATSVRELLVSVQVRGSRAAASAFPAASARFADVHVRPPPRVCV